MREAIFPDEKTIRSLLQAWQAGGAPDDFHQLWKGIKSIVESTVRKSLCRQGIRDPSAADEAISLVIERYLASEPQIVTAKFLGISEGTVTRVRQRAIQRLRELLPEGATNPRTSKPR